MFWKRPNLQSAFMIKLKTFANKKPINLKPKSSLIDLKKKLKSKFELLEAQTELSLLKMTISKFKSASTEHSSKQNIEIIDQKPELILTIEPDIIPKISAKGQLRDIFLQEYMNVDDFKQNEEDEENEEEVDIARKVELVNNALHKSLFA